MVEIGMIGYGYWGPNHVRVFSQLPDCHVRVVADADEKRLQSVRRPYPDARTTGRYEDVLEDPGVQAVVIATPAVTHYGLVKAALAAGKDVLVEKPISYTAAEAQELVDLADRGGRVLMCGHIFLFNPGIRKLREYVQEGALGRIYYMAATRTNLGPYRRDVNALYDLGSHDVSIFHHLLGTRPLEAVAWGASYLQQGIEDVTFATLEYPDRTLCHMHVSWLNPRRERTLVVVGSKKMAVWDDTSAAEAVRLYDKGLDQEPTYDSFGQFQLALRDADVLIPRLKPEEPLRAQDQHFLDCVRSRRAPLADGRFARDVVLTVEALQRSLREGDRRQTVEAYPPAPAP